MTARAPVLYASGVGPDPSSAVAAALARFGAERPLPRGALVLSAAWTSPRALGVTSGITHRINAPPDAPQPAGAQVPAQGSPDLAARAAAALEVAGFRAILDPSHGLDAGPWAVLRHLFPIAELPVVQVALPQLPPQGLLRFGAALAPFRTENVWIVASGRRGHRTAPGAGEAQVTDLDTWLEERALRGDREALLRRGEAGPPGAGASASEALGPLLAALGATVQDDRPLPISAEGSVGTEGIAWVSTAR